MPEARAAEDVRISSRARRQGSYDLQKLLRLHYKFSDFAHEFWMVEDNRTQDKIAVIPVAEESAAVGTATCLQ